MHAARKATASSGLVETLLAGRVNPAPVSLMAERLTKRVLVLPIEGQPFVQDVAWEPQQDQQFEFTRSVAGLLGLAKEDAGATEIVSIWTGESGPGDQMAYVQLVMREDRTMPVNQLVPHLHGNVCAVGLVDSVDEYWYHDFDRYRLLLSDGRRRMVGTGLSV